jgi:hypothetical protein
MHFSQLEPKKLEELESQLNKSKAENMCVLLESIGLPTNVLRRMVFKYSVFTSA